MILIEDDRQKVGKHIGKNRHWLDNGWRVVRARLPFGDYALLDERDIHLTDDEVVIRTPFARCSFAPCVVVDTKYGIAELAGNLQQDHKRFRSECIAAQDADARLVVMVETEEVSNLKDLARWQEPLEEYRRRGGRKRYNGETLAKICASMHKKYGVYFDFTPKQNAGNRVIELLDRGEKWKT